MQAVLDNIGFLGMNSGWDSITLTLDKNGIDYDIIDHYQIWDNLTGNGKVDIGRYRNDNETRYFAEFTFRIAIDDYNTTSYIFNRKPSKKTIKNMWLLDNLHSDLIRNNLDLEFDCWECGHHTHWVDINISGLEQKIEAWKDNYCGC